MRSPTVSQAAPSAGSAWQLWLLRCSLVSAVGWLVPIAAVVVIAAALILGSIPVKA